MSTVDPRVLIVSLQGAMSDVSVASSLEFADVAALVARAEVITPKRVMPADPSRVGRFVDRAAGKVGWQRTEAVKFVETKLERDYDLLFVRVNAPDELRVLDAIPNWRERCKIAVCAVDELWVNWLAYKVFTEPLKAFDHVFVSHVPTPAVLQGIIGVPSSFLASAVDALRFCPLPKPPARTTDVWALGRRSPARHDALSAHARANPEFHYVYDSARLRDFTHGHVDHRVLTANNLKRTKYFLADRAKVDSEDETGGVQVFGPRYFEGASAGAILIGEHPNCATFRENFDWPDALFNDEFKSTRIVDVVRELEAQPDRVSRARINNMTQVLRRHDWAHRWQSVLRTLSFDGTSALEDRFRALNARASECESAPFAYARTS